MYTAKTPPSAGLNVVGQAKPAATYASEPDSSYSIINEAMKMKGDVESDANILVQGKVLGNIACKLLIVDHSAHIEGEIKADEIVVRGTTTGVLRARRVRFEKSAVVDSEIWHQSFSAEEGARITGALRYSDEPRPRRHCLTPSSRSKRRNRRQANRYPDGRDGV